MSEGQLDKSPLGQQKGATSSLQYPVRRMRNTAVLVKWIEDHQSNPYPTKAEKQYLAYYSGMNLTQLSTWFANARRRIKKIGMKTWLEGRSTFTVDLFPSPTLQPTRPMTADYAGYAASPYTGLTGSAYTYSTLGYPTQHPSTAIGLQAASQRVHNGPSSTYTSEPTAIYQTSISSGSTMNGLYGASQQRMASQPLIGMSAFNWHTMPAATPLSLATTSAGTLQQSRPSSNTRPIHSPLTAYSAVDSAEALRSHSGLSLEVGDGTYSQQHPSPAEQMLPECASTEPILQGSPKTHYTAQAD